MAGSSETAFGVHCCCSSPEQHRSPVTFDSNLPPIHNVKNPSYPISKPNTGMLLLWFSLACNVVSKSSFVNLYFER